MYTEGHKVAEERMTTIAISDLSLLKLSIGRDGVSIKHTLQFSTLVDRVQAIYIH
jgi:hypothetical protein